MCTRRLKIACQSLAIVSPDAKSPRVLSRKMEQTLGPTPTISPSAERQKPGGAFGAATFTRSRPPPECSDARTQPGTKSESGRGHNLVPRLHVAVGGGRKSNSVARSIVSYRERAWRGRGASEVIRQRRINERNPGQSGKKHTRPAVSFRCGECGPGHQQRKVGAALSQIEIWFVGSSVLAF